MHRKLLGLLLFGTAVCSLVVLAFFATHLVNEIRCNIAVRQLKRSGATLSFRADTEVRVFGVSLTDGDCIFVDCSSCELSEADFDSMGRLRHIEGIRLHDANFDEQWLSNLSYLRQLRELDMSRTEITGNAFKLIDRIETLEQLNVTLCLKLTAKDIEYLESACASLRVVYLPTGMTQAISSIKRQRPDLAVWPYDERPLLDALPNSLKPPEIVLDEERYR